MVLTTRLMSLAGRGSLSDVVETSFRKLCSPSPLLIAFTRRPYSSSPVSGMLIILKSRAAADYRWTFTRRWSLHAKIQRGRRNKEKCYWPNTTFDVTTRRVCPCRQMSKWCYYYYGVISHRAPSLNSFYLQQLVWCVLKQRGNLGMWHRSGRLLRTSAWLRAPPHATRNSCSST